MNPKSVLAKLDARVEAIACELAQAGISEITTIKKVARYLGMTYGFVWSRVQQHELESIQCGRVLRLRRSEVARWIAVMS